MNIEVKPEKNKQVDIEITIDDFVVNKHLKTAATKISQSVNIPGFRKGKAPMDVVESIYGPEIRQEVLWDLASKTFTKIVQEKDCLLYTSPSPRDLSTSRMPSSA